MGQGARHDLGGDRRPQRGPGERADELCTVDVRVVQQLAQHVRADHGNDQRRLLGNHRLVSGRGLECAHTRAVGLVRHAHAREPATQAPEELQRHTAGSAGPGVGRSDDEHVAVCGQRGPDARRRRLGRGDVRGRQRDLRGEDVGGGGRDHALAGLDHLARQAKHRGGLAAPADERDDVVARHAERVGQPHPRAPAAPRSISALAPAWTHGKKLVITTRTPSWV